MPFFGLELGERGDNFWDLVMAQRENVISEEATDWLQVRMKEHKQRLKTPSKRKASMGSFEKIARG